MSEVIQYKKIIAKRLDALPDEEKTEEKGIDWQRKHLGGATYGGHPITQVNFWFDRVNVWYDASDDPVLDFDEEYDDSLPPTWDNIGFHAEVDDDGTIRLTKVPVGFVPPGEARESDSPGANSSEEVYDLLEKMGFVLDMKEYYD